jgi:hypothetical protein
MTTDAGCHLHRRDSSSKAVDEAKSLTNVAERYRKMLDEM